MPNSGCLSSVLRRLLCSGNLPTHPSEALNVPKPETKPVARAAEPGPGVVARLMGLSSLPDVNWVPNHRAPGAVPRSKSVNFADYLLHFDSNQAHHRRIRSSASFREVPPSNPHKDFFVLYTKDYFDGYAVEIEPGLKKPETQRFGEEKQGKEQSKSNDVKKKGNGKNELKISKLKDEPRREIGKNLITKGKKCSRGKNDSVSVLPSGKYSYKQSVSKNGGAVNSNSVQKKQKEEAAIGTELNKKMKKKKNVSRHVEQKPEPEFDPENSSPVSVLDVNFPDERQMELITEKNRDFYTNSGCGRSESCSEVVERICRLAEEDIREAKWRVKNVYEIEELEELCMEVERHVVNVLLVQTLDEFVYL